MSLYDRTRSGFSTLVDSLTATQRSLNNGFYNAGLEAAKPFVYENEIKSAVDEVVEVYVSHSEADIRGLLEEAVRSGVRLSGAQIVTEESFRG